MWKGSQYFGENNVQSTCEKNSWKVWIGALVGITEKKKPLKSVNQSILGKNIGGAVG